MSTTSRCCWCDLPPLPAAVGPQPVAIKIEMFASYWQKNSHGSGYPAFFFVLGKAAKGAENAVIPTFPTHWSHGLQHLRHKRRNVRFNRLRRVHTPPQPLTAHTAAYTAKHGRFGRGVVSLPSERFARFGNPAWPGVRTANFAVFWPWSDVLPKNAESLRNSDALMRVAVSRRRGPAGLRDPIAVSLH